MFQKEFDSNYVGFTVDGAKWLVENTDIKLVGRHTLFYIFWLLFPMAFILSFVTGSSFALVNCFT